MRSLTLHALLAACVVAGASGAQDAAAALKGVEKTAHFEIRFKPGSRAEASVDRVVVLAEKDLEKILAELALPGFSHKIRLFLYEDVEQLQILNRIACGGFSAGLDSHVVHDDDQTRLHELVHVVAASMPAEGGTETRNGFIWEGLANAILRFVHGVHVDAVASFYKKKGKLPPVAEMLDGDFYEWLQKHPGFNGYDVGGSFVRYLLDTYGPLKTRKYYRGVPAKAAFGADLAEIEKGWHKRLDAVVLRPGLLALLEDRDDPVGALKRSAEAKLSPATLGPASEWKALDGAEVFAGDPAKWEGASASRALVLSGEKSRGDWSIARISVEPLGDAIVRCRAEAKEGCYGVQIQIGPGCQAIVLRGQGAFLYRGGLSSAHDGSPTLAAKPVEIVLRRRGARASAWVDGVLVLEGDVEKGPSVLGVGCVGGPARITGLAVRRL